MALSFENRTGAIEFASSTENGTAVPFGQWLVVFAAASAALLVGLPSTGAVAILVAVLSVVAVGLTVGIGEGAGVDPAHARRRRAVTLLAPAIIAALLYLAVSASAEAAHLVASGEQAALLSCALATIGFAAMLVLHTGLVFAAQFALARARGRNGDAAVAVYVADGFAGLAGRLD